jgi:hypothetical protein
MFDLRASPYTGNIGIREREKGGILKIFRGKRWDFENFFANRRFQGRFSR